MQSASSRIWTRVAVSISYNDNHYTTGTSTFFFFFFHFQWCYNLHLQTNTLEKGMNLISLAMDWIELLLFFVKDGLSIK